VVEADKSEDRYKYLDSGRMKPITDTADAAAGVVKKFHCTSIINSRESVVNAVMIKNQLGQPVGPVPNGILELSHVGRDGQEYTESVELVPVSRENPERAREALRAAGAHGVPLAAGNRSSSWEYAVIGIAPCADICTNATRRMSGGCDNPDRSSPIGSSASFRIPRHKLWAAVLFFGR